LLWLSESHELLVAGSFNRIKVRRARGGVLSGDETDDNRQVEGLENQPDHLAGRPREFIRFAIGQIALWNADRARRGAVKTAIKLNCVDLAKPEPSQEFAFSNGEGDVAAIDSSPGC